MARRGRPRGLVVNVAALHDLLAMQELSKSQLCAAAGVSPGHLADMVHRAKGASLGVMRRLATVLNCDVATLAPELGGFAVAVGVAGERVALRPEPRSESAGR